MTWYGWDGDRLVTTQTEASRVQTIYSPGSFRVETPVAALEAAGRHRTLAEKLQEDGSEDGGGVTFPPELVQMLDRLEGELRTDSVSEASRT
ncbi:hypothetical protein DIR64_22755 [Salmonella enterica subsp. enterica serovar Tafo]|nr:hypothetical protein [Salmonella enterica subsp. enterica serovar Ughelli]EBU8678164.1 hypothetical protein [Salmonella enterica subsp. enterica serovar Parkroyal]EBW0605234.1 hypothetical protein [Salmonella enterica subsp. enterica serovar Teddington]EEA5913760.1 hypothetical protein [Salmonella enterica subsp. enterica serovar Tafo]